MYTSTQNGTHAGWRTLKPAYNAWECPNTSCRLLNPGYRAQCGQCGAERIQSVRNDTGSE